MRAERGDGACCLFFVVFFIPFHFFFFASLTPALDLGPVFRVPSSDVENTLLVVCIVKRAAHRRAFAVLHATFLNPVKGSQKVIRTFLHSRRIHPAMAPSGPTIAPHRSGGCGQAAYQPAFRSLAPAQPSTPPPRLQRQQQTQPTISSAWRGRASALRCPHGPSLSSPTRLWRRNQVVQAFGEQC